MFFSIKNHEKSINIDNNPQQQVTKDLFAGIEGLESTEFLQTDAEVSPIVNKTKFTLHGSSLLSQKVQIGS